MSISHLTNSEFISKVIQDSDGGRGFVPLVGSGLSSPSGIIMGMEFTNYLAFVTFLVLSDPKGRERTHGEGQPRHWDLRHQGWPPLPSDSEVESARQWLLEEFKTICDRYGLDLNFDDNSERKRIRALTPKTTRPASHEVLAGLVQPQVPAILASNDLVRTEESVRRVADLLLRRAANNSRSSSAAAELLLSDSTRSYRDRIVETGVRALHDWRETLVFLASVEVQSSGLVYGVPVNSVIDRFNSFITRDKQPNLGHKMLAHLSGPLRIHTVLTTNFDTLIEDAFRSLQYRVRVLPVSSKGQLPEPQTVGSEFSVVKLHGEVQDTRADLTLDEEPSDADKCAFIAYLTHGAGHLRRDPPSREDSKRLLVIGYSGADHRCVQMIKHWLEKGSEQPSTHGRHVPGQIAYWVCFSQSDVDKVKRLFQAKEYSDRIRITQSARPDLLMYELYQRLVLSLPPGGLTYEFSHVVPPRRVKAFDYSDAQIGNVLSCAKTLEHPLEAARVLLSEAASLDDARRLCRDAAVLELKLLILDAIHGRLSFYDQDGNYRPRILQQCVATQWSPLYRRPDALPRNRSYDSRELYSGFKFRPVMIDSLGGVVRGVAEAVMELSASMPQKKVFWIETQDYMDADALLRDLLRSLAVRCGSFQGRQVTQHPLDANLGQSSLPRSRDRLNVFWEDGARKIGDHLQRVLADYRLDAHEIVVLIYGRDGYGGCSGLIPSLWGCRDAELDPTQGEPRPEQAMCSLHSVLEGLGRAGIRTLYFPLTSPRGVRKNQFPSKPGPATAKSAIATTENGRVWQLARPNSVDWDRWMSDRDFYEHWREWPSDPFATRVLTPRAATVKRSENAGEATRDLISHEVANGASVFQGIVEHVLEPYFEFSCADAEASARRTVRQRSFECTRDVERKLVFLYSLTLFRHSRHVNALCSEAAYQCPNRFNANAVDNDFMRSEEIIRWIDELRHSRVFFDKPGGSVWMHRDIRLTLRYFLEHLDLQGVTADGEPRRDNSRNRNRYLLEMRSRLHFWIGDWYHKAFCSSGHLTPIIESVHHRIMAALFAPFARYKAPPTTEGNPSRNWKPDAGEQESLLQYRMILVESSLIEAQKTIYVAWKSLKLWQPSPLEVSWIGERHRAEIGRCIERAIQALLDEYYAQVPNVRKLNRRAHEEKLRRSKDGLLSSLEALSQELLLEGGGGERMGDGSEAKPTSPRPSPLNSGLSAYADGRLSTFSSSPDAATREADRIRLDHGWRTINLSWNQFAKHVSTAFRSADVDAERLLRSIEKIAKAALGELAESDQLVVGLSQQKATWKATHSHHPQRLHDMIWLLGEYGYIMLRRAKLLYHARGRIDFSHWVRSTVACNLGVDFCKHLPAWLLRFDIQSKVKLHSLYGVSLANVGRFFEATRHFNEAQALLSKMPDASRADLSVIMLRRAEALITECLWIRMFILECKSRVRESTRRTAGNDQDSFSDAPLPCEEHRSLVAPGREFRLIDGEPDSGTWTASLVQRELSESNTIAVPPRIAESLRKSAPSGRSGHDPLRRRIWAEGAERNLTRLYKSTLDEAVALLESAEHNLSGHSQSSLWWSRLHTLRLRAYGLLPVLGDSASDSLLLRKTSAEQGIFESYRHAIRIARNDPFRRLRAAKYFFDADLWHRGHERQDTPLELGSPNALISRLPESFSDAIDVMFTLASDRQLDLHQKPLTDNEGFETCLKTPTTTGRDPETKLLQSAIARTIADLLKRDRHFKDRWNQKCRANSKDGAE